MHTVDLRQAGHRLMQLRLAADGMTQQELEAATARLEEQGIGKRVYAQQISRIEKGQLDRPPIMDLLSIGRVLQISTAQLLELYGLWYEPEPEGSLHPTLRKAQETLARLAPEDAERFLNWVDFAITQARAEQTRRTAPRRAVEARR